MSELPRAVCSELKAIVNRRGRMGKVRQGVLLCKQSSGSSLERPSVGALNEQSVYITCRVMTIKPLSLHIPTVVEREKGYICCNNVSECTYKRTKLAACGSNLAYSTACGKLWI